MQENIQILLIGYLDNELGEFDRAAVKQLLGSGNNEVNSYMQDLLLAKEAVQHAALYEQVNAVKKQYEAMTAVSTMPVRQATVRTMMPTLMRIAAAVILLVGVSVVYKFMNTSSSGFYLENYSSYELPVSRGGNSVVDIEQLYLDKNWKAVINSFNSLAVKDNKALFLAGMAYMELKQFDNAATLFVTVINQNKISGDNLFQDEAEYYLALSYIAENQPGKGVGQLNKIRSDKDHLFYQKASEMSSIDLKILKIKGE